MALLTSLIIVITSSSPSTHHNDTQSPELDLVTTARVLFVPQCVTNQAVQAVGVGNSLLCALGFCVQHDMAVVGSACDIGAVGC